MGDDYQFDPDQPIEETEGYLGHIWETENMYLDSELAALADFDFSSYGALAEEDGSGIRELKISFEGQEEVYRFEAIWAKDIIKILPFVDVIYDSPPDQGLASGGAWIFLRNEHYWSCDTEACTKKLRSALDDDFKLICKSSGYDIKNYPKSFERLDVHIHNSPRYRSGGYGGVE
jgi:hypothetical protein